MPSIARHLVAEASGMWGLDQDQPLNQRRALERQRHGDGGAIAPADHRGRSVAGLVGEHRSGVTDMQILVGSRGRRRLPISS